MTWRGGAKPPVVVVKDNNERFAMALPGFVVVPNGPLALHDSEKGPAIVKIWSKRFDGIKLPAKLQIIVNELS
jgi:hypothetical protein